MQLQEHFEVRWNLEILGFDRGKRRVLHQRTHNIIVNNGRQFMAETISASAFGVTPTRVQNAVVRYVGVGIGGSRQAAAAAAASPLSDTYPAGYAGGNTQTDNNVAVSRLERPVKVTSSLWLKQVAAPPAFPTARSVMWTALFDATDVNVSPYTTMPLSEIGLYSSLADPALPNGGAGSYPGATNHMIAYDTFLSLEKTGFWSMQVNWTWQF